MSRQFKLIGFPEGAFKRSLGALYDYFAQRGGYAGAGLDIAPVADALTTGASPIAATLAAYETVLTTGGTQAAETVSVPAGEFVGQRKLFTLGTRTHASDKARFAVTNIDRALHAGETPSALTVVELDAVGEYLLLEWTGAKWNIVYAVATMTV
jgi:hypothetical protein